ncbi:hypothetical protein V6C31_01570, partial [Caldibacillus debilis]|uniref:hypothetical protein n=1 Tax=Caldibacillus debilis TaxID=301148 RepID=UPI002FDB7E13
SPGRSWNIVHQTMRFMKSYETSLDHNHILDYCELLHLLLQFKPIFFLPSAPAKGVPPAMLCKL